MNAASEEAFFVALARFAGIRDGRESPILCDLSGTVPGRLTATDIIDQLSADAGRSVPEDIRKSVIESYTTAYNISARGEHE